MDIIIFYVQSILNVIIVVAPPLATIAVFGYGYYLFQKWLSKYPVPVPVYTHFYTRSKAPDRLLYLILIVIILTFILANTPSQHQAPPTW